jgi:hypothetical protein
LTDLCFNTPFHHSLTIVKAVGCLYVAGFTNATERGLAGFAVRILPLTAAAIKLMGAIADGG